MNNKIMETDQLGHVVTAEELTIDERDIIREQERLAQEKKKKIRRKRRNILFAILGVLVIGCVGWYRIWGKTILSDDVRTTVEIRATANQSVMFVKVDSIGGNEISYTVLQELAAGTENTEPQDKSYGENGTKRPGKSGFSGGMPEGASEQSTLGSLALQYNGVGYRLTDETAIVLLPVGTEVITKLGTATTFSRISAGDCLALVTEKIDGEETIMAVYIVG